MIDCHWNSRCSWIHLIQYTRFAWRWPEPRNARYPLCQGRVFVDPNDPNTLHYEGFDPGARFSNLAPPRVPPPPPGVMPNPAQLALMQGRNVVVTQRKANVISGGSSGGVDTSCTLQWRHGRPLPRMPYLNSCSNWNLATARPHSIQ